MRRTLIILGLLVVLAVGLRFVLLGTAPDVAPPPEAEAAYADNTLPPCPDSPNCVRTTRVYPEAPDDLFLRATEAVEAMGPASVETAGTDLNAVFSVFLFKDDFDVALTPTEQGTALHVRSASRVGYSDLGVNARRVSDFFDRMETVSDAP